MTRDRRPNMNPWSMGILASLESLLSLAPQLSTL